MTIRTEKGKLFEALYINEHVKDSDLHTILLLNFRQLYTTATNVCLNIIRTEKRRPKTNDEEILLQLAGSDNPEKKALTIHFLDRLFADEKESTKTIAVLHYLDKLTLDETAAAVGLSVSGVRKRLRNLRAKGLTLKEV